MVDIIMDVVVSADDCAVVDLIKMSLVMVKTSVDKDTTTFIDAADASLEKIVDFIVVVITDTKRVVLVVAVDITASTEEAVDVKTTLVAVGIMSSAVVEIFSLELNTDVNCILTDMTEVELAIIALDEITFVLVIKLEYVGNDSAIGEVNTTVDTIVVALVFMNDVGFDAVEGNIVDVIVLTDNTLVDVTGVAEVGIVLDTVLIDMTVDALVEVVDIKYGAEVSSLLCVALVDASIGEIVEVPETE